MTIYSFYRLETILWDWLSSSLDFWDQIQAIRLGNKCSYRLSYLTGPITRFCLFLLISFKTGSHCVVLASLKLYVDGVSLELTEFHHPVLPECWH